MSSSWDAWIAIPKPIRDCVITMLLKEIPLWRDGTHARKAEVIHAHRIAIEILEPNCPDNVIPLDELLTAIHKQAPG